MKNNLAWWRGNSKQPGSFALLTKGLLKVEDGASVDRLFHQSRHDGPLSSKRFPGSQAERSHHESAEWHMSTPDVLQVYGLRFDTGQMRPWLILVIKMRDSSVFKSGHRGSSNWKSRVQWRSQDSGLERSQLLSNSPKIWRPEKRGFWHCSFLPKHLASVQRPSKGYQGAREQNLSEPAV